MSSMRGGGSRGARVAQGSASRAPNLASRGSSNYPSRDNSHGSRRANNAAKGAPSFTTQRNAASSRGGRGGGGSGTGRGNVFDKPQPPAKKGLGGDALPSGNWQEREQKLKVHREQEKRDAIARGLMSDPDVQTKLENAITLVGTCQDMCPEHERVRRVVQRGLWDEERNENGEPDESRMVKIFRRSAAGDEVQLPSDLRPPSVLKRVCDYLFNDLVGTHELSEIHHFVWDRTRAVRNDFSIQQLSKLEDLAIAIECYERIARFHIMSLHQLAVAPQPYPQYSPGQEKEQLDRTLLSLMQYYDDTRGRLELQNEAEFRSYCVVLQLKDPIVDLEDRVQAWPRSISRDHRVRTALEIYAAASHIKEPKGPMNPQLRPVIARQDWASFWKLIESRKTSYLLACVAEVHFNIVREQMLNAIIRTARRRTAKDGRVPPDTEWGISELQLLFNFNDDVELREYVGRWGLVFQQSPDADDEYLDIRHIAGRPLPGETKTGPTQLRSELVELKRHDRTYPAIIDGMNVRTARKAGMIMQFPEDAEDAEDTEDSLFVVENNPTKTVLQNASTGVSVEAPPPSFGMADGGFSFGAPSNPNFNQPFSTFGQPSGGLGFGAPSNSHAHRTSPFRLPSTTPANDGSNAFKLQSAEPAEAKRETTKSPFAIFSSPAVSGSPSINTSAKTNPFVPAPPKPATTGSSETKAGNSEDSVTELLLKANASTSAKPITTTDITGESVAFKPKPVKTGPFIEDPGSSSPPSAGPQGNPVSETFGPSSSNSQTAPDIKTVDNPAGTLGTTFGQPASGSQSESNPKWPPSQQPSQPHAPASITNTPASSSHSNQNATVTSPVAQTARRPSSASWETNKPKKPSPLSNSFTANSEVTPPGFSSPALESAKRETPPDKQENSIKPLPPRASQSNAAPLVQDSEAILTRLAAELTYAPRGGIYKQFIDFYVSEVVKEAWTRFTEDYLKQKYFGRWKSMWESARQARWEAARYKERLVEKGRQVRERARRRLEASQRGELDENAAATGKNKKLKETMKSLKQSARNGWRSQEDQAKSGSKRAASDHAVQLTNGTDPKRLKKLNRMDSPERATKPVPEEDHKADVLRRSSFLAFSLPSDAVNHAPTTQSTYFRMKALGIHKLHETSNSSQPRGIKRMRSESFGSGSVRSSARDASSFLGPASQQSQDADAMPPPSVQSVRSRTHEDDDALFARLRAAREALKEGADFMKDETEKEELRRSMSRSQSSNESPSMARARAEARLRASSRATSDFGALSSRRDVPAYRLRQSRFLSAEDQARAIERARDIRASRGSRESSRPQSTAESAVQSLAMGKTLSGAASKLDPTAAEAVEGKNRSTNGTSGGLINGLSGALAKPANSISNKSSGEHRSPNRHQTGHLRNPFTQSSPFAPPASSGTPLLPTGTRNRIVASPGRIQQELNSRSIQIPPSASFAITPSQSVAEESQDHTIAPSQIPEALSQSFGQSHPWAREDFHFDTTHECSTAPQTNAFMPLNGQTETISLLSDDEEEEDAGGNTAYDEQPYFGNNLHLTNNISQAEDSEAQSTNDALDAALQGTYGDPNYYATLAEEANQLAVQYAEGDAATEEEIEEYGEEDAQDEPAGFGSYEYDTDFKGENDEYAQEAYAENSDQDNALDEDHSGYEEDADEEDEEGDLDDEGSVEDGDLEEEEYFANYAYKQHTQSEPRGLALPDGGNTAEEAIELSD